MPWYAKRHLQNDPVHDRSLAPTVFAVALVALFGCGSDGSPGGQDASSQVDGSAEARSDAGGDSGPDSWQQAWDTWDQEIIDTWYEENTGFAAYFDQELDRKLTEADLEVFGTITTEHDGQIIERVHIDGQINIVHDDVTVRGCRIDNTATAAHVASISFPDGARQGTLVEYCTFRQTHTDGFTRGVGMHVAGDFSGTKIRYNQWPTDHEGGVALRCNNAFGSPDDPIVFEYNYIRRVNAETRPTALGMRSNGGDIRDYVIRRNNMRGGGSGVWTLYNRGDFTGYWGDVLLEENLINVDDRERNPEGFVNAWYEGGGTIYAVRFPNPNRENDFGGFAANTTVRANRFGRWSYPATGRSRCALHAGTNVAEGENNVWDDNAMMPAPGWPEATEVGPGCNEFGDSRTDWSFNESEGGWEYTPGLSARSHSLN